MSQADGNSTEGETASGTTGRATQVGCYRNFDHFPSRHRRSNSSQPAPSLPNAAGPEGGLSNPPPPPPSPPAQQQQELLLDLPLVASQPEEQQPLTRSPGEYTSPVRCFTVPLVKAARDTQQLRLAYPLMQNMPNTLCHFVSTFYNY
jgi:hypothetical protein